MTTRDRDDLAAAIYATSHITGEFVLRSGVTSTEYFDKYRFEADPALLRDIAAALVPLVPEGTEVLAGLELGGVPIATVLSQLTGIPATFVRKEAKTYGTCQLAEGAVDRRQASDRGGGRRHVGRSGGASRAATCASGVRSSSTRSASSTASRVVRPRSPTSASSSTPSSP